MLAFGLFMLPSAIGVNENDYRAWVTWVDNFQQIPGETGGNVTADIMVTFVPIYPSETYTMTANVPIRDIVVDLSKPTTVQAAIAEAVRDYGANGIYFGTRLNYSVIKVYVPDYSVVVP